MSDYEKDLIILVADSQMEHAVKGILSRPQALNIRDIRYDIYTHQLRDPGCFNKGHEFLRPFVRQYEHGLLMFDREGSGQEHLSRDQLETKITDQLERSGWDDRAITIVLDPELENWVWSDSPQVDSCLGFAGEQLNLRTWLKEEGYWNSESSKPQNPKDAMNYAMKHARKPRSASIYEQLGRTVSFNRCTDPAFCKFKQVLQEWF